MTDARGYFGCLLLLVLAGATGVCLYGIHALFGDGGVGFVAGVVVGSIMFTPVSGDKESAPVDGGKP